MSKCTKNVNKNCLELIKSDLSRLGNVSIKNFLVQYFIPRGNTFPYMVWLRIAHASRKTKLMKYTVGLLTYAIFRHYEFRYGIHANLDIYIGEGFRVVHGEGVFLNCSYIGDNVTIFQGVTCGSNHGNGEPYLDDGVSIYPGAVVVGKIVLNKNCTVRANSYVSHNVEAESVVAGLPAKRIR